MCPMTSSVTKARALSQDKRSNLPKVTQPREGDLNPENLALRCCFLSESLSVSSSSPPPHLTWGSLLQQSPEFIAWHELTHLQKWGAYHLSGGPVVSWKTVSQVCGLLNKSPGLKMVSWETEQPVQPAGAWCGLAYRWRNLGGANKPHVWGQERRCWVDIVGWLRACTLGSFPSLSLNLSSVNRYLQYQPLPRVGRR